MPMFIWQTLCGDQPGHEVTLLDTVVKC